jgi:hypothetical protein
VSNVPIIFASDDFWKSFWPNWWASFAADLIVGIFLAGLITWLIRKRQRVGLTMATTLRVMEGGGARADFSIVNEGNVVMRKDDVHYHIFVRENQIPVKVLNRLSHLRRTKFMGNMDVEIKGTLSSSVFPSRSTYVEDIETQSTEFELHDFLYYLSTASGIFPRTCKINNTTRKISGLGAMSWFHVFPPEGEAKVITPKQKLVEMIATSEVKVRRSSSIKSRVAYWLRGLRNVKESYGIEMDESHERDSGQNR